MSRLPVLASMTNKSSLRSMLAWLARNCCRSTIWWTQAMSMQPICCTVNTTMQWTYLVPCVTIDFRQADADFDVTHFSIDWQAQTVICPHGQISSSWTPAQDAKGHPVITREYRDI